MKLRKTDDLESMMEDCVLCPRRCHKNRAGGEMGYCGQSGEITAARAALHFWEEPCISGSCGSGAVFFAGCSLQCVFCQNYAIARHRQNTSGHDMSGPLRLSIPRLSEIFLELQEKGAANINLVTAAHFLPQVRLALIAAKENGLSIPIVYNSSGYEEVPSLRLLEGLVDIYLPDLKYRSSQLSAQYSHAADYFEIPSAAIAEMFRQTGRPVLEDHSGLMKKGVIVRHLLLPGQAGDSKRVLRYLHETYGNDIYVSIMNQYTPMPHVAKSYPELNRPVTEAEYERVLDFACGIGIENGFMQIGQTASESFIPKFDRAGLEITAPSASYNTQNPLFEQAPPHTQSSQSQT